MKIFISLQENLQLFSYIFNETIIHVSALLPGDGAGLCLPREPAAGPPHSKV